MHNHQYRVWDIEKGKWMGFVFLGPDGFLYCPEYELAWNTEWPLQEPDWFSRERITKRSRLYTLSNAKMHEEIRAKQHEWYIVESSTGYPDKDGKMIFQGDIVKADWHWTKPHTIKWPDDQYAFVEYSLDSNNVAVIGNIHENPELLEVK